MTTGMPVAEANMTTFEEALNRVRAEFLEMPGMYLRVEQVQRLCGVERGLCQAVLDSLVDAKYLGVSPGGQYARVTSGEVASHRSPRAHLGSDTRAQSV
jgi:hypothetical protein